MYFAWPYANAIYIKLDYLLCVCFVLWRPLTDQVHKLAQCSACFRDHDTELFAAQVPPAFVSVHTGRAESASVALHQ